ncbi:MAG: spermidine/putrescine ABC transporter substrate-binding protein, partial [Microterricola sp.]
RAIRAEVKLADEFAQQVGRRVCAELVKHRERITAGIARYVEPQVVALLADLGRELDSPMWPSS